MSNQGRNIGKPGSPGWQPVTLPVATRASAPVPSVSRPLVQVPPALAAYRCHGTVNEGDGQYVMLQDRLQELGWTDARYIRITGEQQYDDEQYFTPEWTIAVRGDIPDNKIGRAMRHAARLQAGEDGMNGDEVEQFVEEMSGVYGFDAMELSPQNRAEAGIVLCWVLEADDPFEHCSQDEIDLDYDPDEDDPE